MSYPDLELKVEKLRSDVFKIKERLYKLENGRGGKEQVSADPSKLESNKDYALDWYINQYQNMCKEYNKVKIKLDEKQKVLEMVMDQRGRYVKQLMNTEKKVKEFEENIHNLTKKNQMLRGTIKNHEDRIFDLEEEVRYHEAFANSGKIKELEDAALHKAVAYDKLDHENQILKEDIAGAHAKVKELELDIKYLKDKNRFIRDLNDEYRKMVVNDENKNSSPYVFVVLLNGEPEAIFNSKEAAFKFTADFVKRVGYEHNYILIDRYEINTNVSVVVGTVNAQGEVVDE